MIPTEAMFIANHQDTNLGGTVGWNLTNRGTVGWNLINESKVTKPEIRRTTRSFTNRRHLEAMFRHKKYHKGRRCYTKEFQNSKLLASSKKKLGLLLKKQIFLFFYPLISNNNYSF